jgi:hypothetical protein
LIILKERLGEAGLNRHLLACSCWSNNQMFVVVVVRCMLYSAVLLPTGGIRLEY